MTVALRVQVNEATAVSSDQSRESSRIAGSPSDRPGCTVAVGELGSQCDLAHKVTTEHLPSHGRGIFGAGPRDVLIPTPYEGGGEDRV